MLCVSSPSWRANGREKPHPPFLFQPFYARNEDVSRFPIAFADRLLPDVAICLKRRPGDNPWSPPSRLHCLPRREQGENTREKQELLSRRRCSALANCANCARGLVRLVGFFGQRKRAAPALSARLGAARAGSSVSGKIRHRREFERRDCHCVATPELPRLPGRIYLPMSIFGSKTNIVRESHLSRHGAHYEEVARFSP